MHSDGAGKSQSGGMGAWNQKERIRETSSTDTGRRRGKGPGTGRSGVTGLLCDRGQVTSLFGLEFLRDSKGGKLKGQEHFFSESMSSF